MAAHNKIHFVVQMDGEKYYLYGANGTLYIYHLTNGIVQIVPQKDIVSSMKQRRLAFSEVADLPQEIKDYISTIQPTNRFPKCFAMLPKIRKGGTKIGDFTNREKQMMTELIGHGLVKKSKKNYILA